MWLSDRFTLTRSSDDAEMLVAYPTVPGREADARRLDMSVTAQSLPADLLRMTGYSTCGEAWNDAAAFAADRGYTHLVLAADDLECGVGALAAAAAAIDDGWSPSALIARACPDQDGEDTLESHGDWARIYDGEGDVAVTMTRIPAIRVDWWSPIPPIHYWSDNAVTMVLRTRGVPILASRGFAWRHHWAQPGRISGTGEQATREHEAYVAFEQALILGGVA